MAKASRITDRGVGVCYDHDDPESFTTIFTSSDSTIVINDLKSFRVGDRGISSCGHPTIATSGSTTVFSESGGLHRINDRGIISGGQYICTSASGDIDVE